MFCARGRKRRLRGFAKVADRLDMCLENDGTKPTVFLNARGNDLGRVKSEELFKKLRQALDRIRDKGVCP